MHSRWRRRRPLFARLRLFALGRRIGMAFLAWRRGARAAVIGGRRVVFISDRLDGAASALWPLSHVWIARTLCHNWIARSLIFNRRLRPGGTHRTCDTRGRILNVIAPSSIGDADRSRRSRHDAGRTFVAVICPPAAVTIKISAASRIRRDRLRRRPPPGASCARGRGRARPRSLRPRPPRHRRACGRGSCPRACPVTSRRSHRRS